MKSLLINKIQVYEYSTLRVGQEEKFRLPHFEALAKYHTDTKCQYYSLENKAIRFANYVGVIKVGNLTIEVLPKCDRNKSSDTEADKALWQRVLLDMLKISLQVEAKTTTHADIHIRHHSVLETYLHLFMDEVQKLIHHGLVKKYRFNENNETALKGKLLISKQITQNIVHAERFYVSHQVYDRNNRYNALLYQTLECIQSMNVSVSTTRRCQSLLLDFPECTTVPVSQKTFNRLTYDRKTQAYHTALDLARIILLNYHPDVAGGHNNILAIMFDMNKLWENYIYHSLRKQISDFNKSNNVTYKVTAQRSKHFWQSDSSAFLRPDIVIEDISQYKNAANKSIILDTKWKYQAKVSEQDLRQVYAYNHYFNAQNGYLVYPDNCIDKPVVPQQGKYMPVKNAIRGDREMTCGLLFVNLLENDDKRENMVLRKEIGIDIFKEIH